MGLKFNNNNNLFLEITSKSIIEGNNEYYIMEFPDFVVNSAGKIKSRNLGEKFCTINTFFYEYLKGFNIPSAFICRNSSNTLKFSNNVGLPFFLKVLNVLDKRNSRIFDMKEFQSLDLPFFEVHYGNGKESIITESHLISLNFCSIENIKNINRITSKINALLKSFFERRNYLLAEMNYYFGRYEDKILLTGDFSPLSLKIISIDPSLNNPNPYKLETSNEIKEYSDHLLKIISF